MALSAKITRHSSPGSIIQVMALERVPGKKTGISRRSGSCSFAGWTVTVWVSGSKDSTMPGIAQCKEKRKSLRRASHSESVMGMILLISENGQDEMLRGAECGLFAFHQKFCPPGTGSGIQIKTALQNDTGAKIPLVFQLQGCTDLPADGSG